MGDKGHCVRLHLKVVDMQEDDSSRFSVYSIRELPAGVWGESYAIVTAFESGSKELTTECFLITKRPKEDMHSCALPIEVSPIPVELGTIDLDFALQEGLREADLLLMNVLEARATELDRPDVAHFRYELKPTNRGDLLGCCAKEENRLRFKAYIARRYGLRVPLRSQPSQRYAAA